MTAIKPDTSLYSEMPDRLRAYILIDELADAGKTIQVTSSQGWLPIKRDKNRFRCRLENVMDCDNRIDYRIAPEPREIWIVSDGKGWDSELIKTLAEADAKRKEMDARYPCDAPHTIARFVEVV